MIYSHIYTIIYIHNLIYMYIYMSPYIYMYIYMVFINMSKVTSLCMVVYVKKHKVTKWIGNKIHKFSAKYDTARLPMFLQRPFLYKQGPGGLLTLDTASCLYTRSGISHLPTLQMHCIINENSLLRAVF